MPLREISGNVRRFPAPEAASSQGIRKPKPHGAKDIPKELRAVILALCKKGHSYAQVSKDTGVPKGTISRIYARATQGTEGESSLVNLIQLTHTYRSNCRSKPIIEPGTFQHHELRAAVM